MQRLESQGGVALFVQGALGDATSTPPEGAGSRLDRMGGKVAEAVAEALGGAEPVEAETRQTRSSPGRCAGRPRTCSA